MLAPPPAGIGRPARWRLFALFVVSRAGLWFALMGLFLICASVDTQGRAFAEDAGEFAWYFIVVVLAALHLVTVFLLGRTRRRRPRTNIEPPEQQSVERDDHRGRAHRRARRRRAAGRSPRAPTPPPRAGSQARCTPSPTRGSAPSSGSSRSTAVARRPRRAGRRSRAPRRPMRRDVCPRSDRGCDVRAGERRRVVHAVTDHRHAATLGLERRDDLLLVLGQHLRADVVDAEVRGDRLGDLLASPVIVTTRRPSAFSCRTASGRLGADPCPRARPCLPGCRRRSL